MERFGIFGLWWKKSLLFLRIESRRPPLQSHLQNKWKRDRNQIIGTNRDKSGFVQSLVYLFYQQIQQQQWTFARNRMRRQRESNTHTGRQCHAKSTNRPNRFATQRIFYLPQSRRRSNERLYFETHEFRPLETLSGSHDPIQRTGFPIGSG